jgi:hypothetical protein
MYVACAKLTSSDVDRVAVHHEQSNWFVHRIATGTCGASTRVMLGSWGQVGAGAPAANEFELATMTATTATVPIKRASLSRCVRVYIN